MKQIKPKFALIVWRVVSRIGNTCIILTLLFSRFLNDKRNTAIYDFIDDVPILNLYGEV